MCAIECTSICGRVILSRSEKSIAPFERIDGDPVFDEPWQAQVLALADALITKNVFTARVWSQTLGAERVYAQAHGAPDTAATYYGAVLDALQRLVEEYGGINSNAISFRQQEWAEAYKRAPHGQPVKLKKSGG